MHPCVQLVGSAHEIASDSDRETESESDVDNVSLLQTTAQANSGSCDYRFAVEEQSLQMTPLRCARDCHIFHRLGFSYSVLRWPHCSQLPDFPEFVVALYFDLVVFDLAWLVAS